MTRSKQASHFCESLAHATGRKSLGAQVGLATFGAHPGGERLEKIQDSPYFDGTRFQNPIATPTDTPMGELAKDYFTGKEQRVPEVDIPILSSDGSQLGTLGSEGLNVTWLGHSSVLLEIDGKRVLTDPVFGPRASPLAWVGPKRFHQVPVQPENLPPLDVIIISHDHYDHLDFPTVSRMAHRDCKWVTALGVGAHLEMWGVPAEHIIELDWWQETEVEGLRVVATPARHFQGRGPSASKATFWGSWSVAGPKHSVWFSGDTGPWSEAFEEIGQRMGGFDLSLVEIGAWNSAWGNIHLGPENALEVHRQVRAKTMMPVHWGTFNLAFHAWDQPICELMRLAEQSGTQILAPMMGTRVHRESGVHSFWQDRYAKYEV